MSCAAKATRPLSEDYNLSVCLSKEKITSTLDPTFYGIDIAIERRSQSGAGRGGETDKPIVIPFRHSVLAAVVDSIGAQRFAEELAKVYAGEHASRISKAADGVRVRRTSYPLASVLGKILYPSLARVLEATAKDSAVMPAVPGGKDFLFGVLAADAKGDEGEMAKAAEDFSLRIVEEAKKAGKEGPLLAVPHALVHESGRFLLEFDSSMGSVSVLKGLSKKELAALLAEFAKGTGITAVCAAYTRRQEGGYSLAVCPSYLLPRRSELYEDLILRCEKRQIRVRFPPFGKWAEHVAEKIRKQRTNVLDYGKEFLFATLQERCPPRVFTLEADAGGSASVWVDHGPLSDRTLRTAWQRYKGKEGVDRVVIGYPAVLAPLVSWNKGSYAERKYPVYSLDITGKRVAGIIAFTGWIPHLGSRKEMESRSSDSRFYLLFGEITLGSSYLCGVPLSHLGEACVSCGESWSVDKAMEDSQVPEEGEESGMADVFLPDGPGRYAELRLLPDAQEMLMRAARHKEREWRSLFAFCCGYAVVASEDLALE